MFDITLIPREVKVLGEKYAAVTRKLETLLQSKEAIEIEAILPGGAQLGADAIAACDIAIKGCNALIAIGDNAGVQARLQRLGATLTQIEHASEKHTISFYITAFETVFHSLFGNGE